MGLDHLQNHVRHGRIEVGLTDALHQMLC
jgi:hypothetical protein